MAAVFRQMVDAVGAMPIFDNPLMRGVGSVLARSPVRAVVAAALVGAYGVYRQYIADVAPLGGLFPALGGLNAPATALAAWGAGEIIKQIYNGGCAYLQARSADLQADLQARREHAITQALDKRRDALKLKVEGAMDLLDQDIHKPEHVSIGPELAALRAKFEDLLDHLQVHRDNAVLVERDLYFQQLKEGHKKVLSILKGLRQIVPQVPPDLQGPEVGLRNRLRGLVIANGNFNNLNIAELPATLQGLTLLDSQLNLRTEVQTKIDLIDLAGKISAQKTRLEAILSKQQQIELGINVNLPQLRQGHETLKAALRKLNAELDGIQAEKGGWFSGKDARLSVKTAEIAAKTAVITTKTAEITAKTAVIGRLIIELLALPGLSLGNVEQEIQRLRLQQDKDPNEKIPGRIQGYMALQNPIRQIALLGPNSEQIAPLRREIQTSPLLTPQALTDQIRELGDALQQLPSHTPHELREQLLAVRNALNPAIEEPAVFGIQEQRFQVIKTQIPNPLRAPAPAAAAAASLLPELAPPRGAVPDPAPAAPAVASLLPEPAPPRAVSGPAPAGLAAAPAVAAAAAPRVDFVMPSTNRGEAPISLSRLSNCQLPPCSRSPLDANPKQTIVDVRVPEQWLPLGGLCFAPAAQMVLKVPFLVDQIPLAISSRVNEKALFGPTGPGGIGETTQKENPKCPKEVLVALKNLAILWRASDLIVDNMYRELAVNLEIVERYMEQLRGLPDESRKKILELAVLFGLRGAAKKGSIPSNDFCKVFRPFIKLHADEVRVKYSAEASKNMFGWIVNLIASVNEDALPPSVGLTAPVTEEVVTLPMDADKSSDGVYFWKLKPKVICMEVPSNKTINATYTIRVSNTTKEITYRVVGVIETPPDGGDLLAATSHTLREVPKSLWGSRRSWHSYNAGRPERVVAEDTGIDLISEFAKGAPGFSPSFIVMVPE